MGGGQKIAVIDGTVNMNVKDADLVLAGGGQNIVVTTDGNVNMNALDVDLVLVSGGQKMAMIDGTVKMNVQAAESVLVSGKRGYECAGRRFGVGKWKSEIQCISVLTSWCQQPIDDVEKHYYN